MEEAAVQELRIHASKPKQKARRSLAGLLAVDMKQFMSACQI